LMVSFKAAAKVLQNRIFNLGQDSSPTFTSSAPN
jgi:hypothetical protein